MESWSRKTRGIHRRGTRAAQPLATDVLIGTLYFVTDDFALERSNGTSWETYGAQAKSTAVSYDAANFTASGGQTWTVAAGDQITYAYVIIGNFMTVWFNIGTSDISGNCFLKLAVPASKIALYQVWGTYRATPPGGASVGAAWRILAGATVIELFPGYAGGNFVAPSANDIAVQGTAVFPIQP